MVNVAIAGGTGGVGRALAETIIGNSRHQGFIFSRTGKSIDGLGLPSVVVDYDDVEKLTAVLEEHDIHTVISTFAITGTSLKISQMNLIKAAAAAQSTKRFIPTSYCIPYQRDFVDTLPPLKDYFACIDALTESDLEWSIVANGIFLDYFGGPHLKSYLQHNAFVLDIRNNTAAIPGSGDELVTFTYTFDVAKYLVAALDLEQWPRELRVIGDEMTFNQFLDVVQEVRGVKFDVHYDSLEKLMDFQVTELPSHPLLYAKYPKDKFQWFQSIFERWTVLGFSHISRADSLNEAFPDLQTLKIEQMLRQSWN